MSWVKSLSGDHPSLSTSGSTNPFNADHRNTGTIKSEQLTVFRSKRRTKPTLNPLPPQPVVVDSEEEREEEERKERKLKKKLRKAKIEAQAAEAATVSAISTSETILAPWATSIDPNMKKPRGMSWAYSDSEEESDDSDHSYYSSDSSSYYSTSSCDSSSSEEENDKNSDQIEEKEELVDEKEPVISNQTSPLSVDQGNLQSEKRQDSIQSNDQINNIESMGQRSRSYSYEKFKQNDRFNYRNQDGGYSRGRDDSRTRRDNRARPDSRTRKDSLGRQDSRIRIDNRPDSRSRKDSRIRKISFDSNEDAHDRVFNPNNNNLQNNYPERYNYQYRDNSNQYYQNNNNNNFRDNYNQNYNNSQNFRDMNSFNQGNANCNRHNYNFNNNNNYYYNQNSNFRDSNQINYNNNNNNYNRYNNNNFNNSQQNQINSYNTKNNYNNNNANNTANENSKWERGTHIKKDSMNKINVSNNSNINSPPIQYRDQNILKRKEIPNEQSSIPPPPQLKNIPLSKKESPELTVPPKEPMIPFKILQNKEGIHSREQLNSQLSKKLLIDTIEKNSIIKNLSPVKTEELKLNDTQNLRNLNKKKRGPRTKGSLFCFNSKGEVELVPYPLVEEKIEIVESKNIISQEKIVESQINQSNKIANIFHNVPSDSDDSEDDDNKPLSNFSALASFKSHVISEDIDEEDFLPDVPDFSIAPTNLQKPNLFTETTFPTMIPSTPIQNTKKNYSNQSNQSFNSSSNNSKNRRVVLKESSTIQNKNVKLI